MDTLTSTKKNFSIVTNHGCRNRCSFCAFANHRLRNVSLETDWDYLKYCLGCFHGNKVSISGGGDPLFQLDTNYGTLNKMVQMSQQSGFHVDIHTNESIHDKLFLLKHMPLNQIVLSAHDIEETRFSEIEELLQFIQVRVVLVYLHQEIDWIKRWIEFYSISPKMTVRECEGDKSNKFAMIKDLLQSFYPQVWFLANGDYNYYYMPDNQVYNDFQAAHLATEFIRNSAGDCLL